MAKPKSNEMKTFEWRYTQRPGDVDKVPSLLELHGDSGIRFWGIMKRDGDLYVPVLLNKERNGYISINESLSMNDAKQAMEKKLMDEGIMSDGDILNDYIE